MPIESPGTDKKKRPNVPTPTIEAQPSVEALDLQDIIDNLTTLSTRPITKRVLTRDPDMLNEITSTLDGACELVLGNQESTRIANPLNRSTVIIERTRDKDGDLVSFSIKTADLVTRSVTSVEFSANGSLDLVNQDGTVAINEQSSNSELTTLKGLAGNLLYCIRDKQRHED